MSIFLISNATQCLALEQACYSNLNEVMKCFIQYEDGAYKYKLQSQKDTDNLSIKTYILDSQKWPIEADNDIATTTWRHKLVVYIPKLVTHNQAMFYVSGGYNADINGQEVFSPSQESLDFANIAINNQAPVVVIEDVPNQYLLINSIPKKEDQILAFTYKKVMEDPMNNAYLAGHLPMVKSIIKGMDASEIILAEHGLNITSFVMVGFSKRGWATWLAALEDERVSAIIPVVIDILNVQKNINHICNSYKNHCPPALRDYQAEGTISSIESNAFASLMEIEDPFNYINLSQYSKQASIPKYIINTSGDDFYAPDSSKFYFKSLKGDNHIRYLPAAMHYFAGNPISDSLNNMKLLNEAVNNYFYFHINNIILPHVSWSISTSKMSIDSSFKPEKIKLWTAHNDEERDFRFLNSYSKFHLGVKAALIYVTKYLPFSIPVCDTCYKEQEIIFNCTENSICHIDVDLPIAKKGWQASFVELYYNIEGRKFIITTEVDISPNTYPEYID
jgi:PhoPQ-activated pathogenicity-related protein